MNIDGITKLLTCLVALISVSVLAYNQIIDPSYVIAVIFTILGYVYGRGHEQYKTKLEKKYIEKDNDT